MGSSNHPDEAWLVSYAAGGLSPSFNLLLQAHLAVCSQCRYELKKADEVFLTGTAAEITPVIKIESKKIGTGKVGEITIQVMNAYSEIVMNNNKKFSKWLTNVY